MKIDYYSKKVLFFIDGDINYLEDIGVDYKEWILGLGYKEEIYDTLICGYIKNNEIVYFYSDFKYDEIVIDKALETCDKIAKDNGMDKYVVYCGVVRGEVWKPILKIK